VIAGGGGRESALREAALGGKKAAEEGLKVAELLEEQVVSLKQVRPPSKQL